MRDKLPDPRFRRNPRFRRKEFVMECRCNSVGICYVPPTKPDEPRSVTKSRRLRMKRLVNDKLESAIESAIDSIYLEGNTVSDEIQTKIKEEIFRIQNCFKISVGSNEGQATEDGGIQGDENARSSSNEDEALSTIQEIAQLHDELALKEDEIASLRQRLNGIDEDLENYTKCCVCLEPYEEGPTSTDNQRRLPIKSATCAHSLCEECLDDYHASLMRGRSTLRYVRCPQCNDKTKKAFDIQNKVVDFFLREYIQCRKRERLT
ncbi:hypothetical protein ACHAWC_009489 [Mediolabrus comicus]